MWALDGSCLSGWLQVLNVTHTLLTAGLRKLVDHGVLHFPQVSCFKNFGLQALILRGPGFTIGSLKRIVAKLHPIMACVVTAQHI